MAYIQSVSRFGKIDKNHVAKRIGHGKAINPTLSSSRATMISAALSALIKNGIGQVFLSVIRDFTNPGQITLISILSFFKLPRNASPYALTQALVALYDGQLGKP